MNKNFWYLAIVVILLVMLGLMIWFAVKSPNQKNNTNNSNQNVANQEIQVTQPLPSTVVTSPLAITGSAVGNWYFEASFPVTLFNSSNQVIGQTTAQAQGDWMTLALVPFTASLTFSPQPAGSSGTLVFENDNPSGDSANAKSYTVNVNF